MSGMKQRLERTERRLSQLIAFFSNVATNPTVLAQMVSTAQANQAFLQSSEARRKKRRHDGAGDSSDAAAPADANKQLIAYKPVDVASFFQQLLVSPLPEKDGPEGGGPSATRDLEAHFNGINLKQPPSEGAPPRGLEIRERQSPEEGTPREGQEAEIEIPEGIAGGVPSIGVAAGGGDARNVFMPRPVGSGGLSDGEMNGLSARSGSLGARAHRNGAARASGSLPPPPPPGDGASLSLDGLDGELLDVGELQDMLQDGVSLGYGAGDAEEWQAMLDDMSLESLPKAT